MLSAPEVESAAPKEENYHDDDEERIGVHESWMLAEHEDWGKSKSSNTALAHYRLFAKIDSYRTTLSSLRLTRGRALICH